MSSTLRAAGSISAWTLVSRILGLVRDGVMTRVLGAGWQAGMFHLAWMLPNMLRRQLGEGALGAAFLPAYTAARERDEREAGSLLAAVTGTMLWILVVLCGLALLVIWAIPAGSLALEAPANTDPAAPELLFRQLVWILLPYGIPVCITAMYAAALQSRGQFGLPAQMPILLNGFWLAGLGTALLSTAGIDGAGSDRLGSIARITAWFLAVGGWSQLLVLAWALARRGAFRRPRMAAGRSADAGASAGVSAGAGPVFRAMVPTALGLSTVQISALADHAMAIYLVDPGANNFIYLANRLLQFPHALTGLALAVAVFPQLASLGHRSASAAGEGDHKARDAGMRTLRQRLDSALATSLLLTVPAAVGMALVARHLVPVLFEGGEFTAADSHSAAWTTMALMVGLPAMGSAQILARAFYALGLPGIPAWISAWMLLLNLVLNAVFVLQLDLGTPGLALATSCSATGNALLLRLRLGRHCPTQTSIGTGMSSASQKGASQVVALAWKVAFSAAAMAGSVWGLQELLADQSRLVRVAAAVAVGALVYGGALVVLRTKELRPVTERLKRRFGRR